ncbi:MAG: DUF4405 domain-containing protein [Phycisphaerales bacterium]|nr:DUF4405 domain-containing protein [Phycisphaerales bacterium]MCB9854359.1 DUF4405 domain-containing protein [Phycisphaerales bacterium]MCB9863560.1 DUF4405 domain-containing protein [Phycisphaerales bacterium]
MRRTTLNFVVDAVAFIVMLGMIATGLVVRFALPPGTGGRWAIWGMGRHDWGGLHYYLALALLVLLLVHLALHWAWTCVIADKLLSSIGLSPGSNAGVQRSRAGRRIAVGCATLAIVAGSIGGFYWLAASNLVVNAHGTIRRNAPAGLVNDGERAVSRDEHNSGRGRAQVKGSMTLGEVAAIAGVSTDRLKAVLGLPGDTADDARIGQIRRAHDLTMSQIRSQVVALSESSAEPS